MVCKVLFLGAGASAHAGYPLCKDIFTFLCKRRIYSRNYCDDWNIYSRFLESHPDFNNIDVENFCTKLEDIISENETLCSEYKLVKLAISRMITDCFGLENYNFRNIIKTTKLNYFKNMIDDSNYIITLNWDNLCEYILADCGRWFPTDGYGIPIPFIDTRKHRRKNGIRQEATIHSISCPESEVIVLKLHGSMGWKIKAPNRLDINYNPQTDKGELFFSDYDFLDLVPDLRSNCNIKGKITDANAPLESSDAYNSEVHMILPSHNKYNNFKTLPELERIWEKAKEVLALATEMQFVGYSLTNDDKHITELIKELRPKVDAGKVKVKCIIGKHDNNGTAERYKHILGDKIEIIYENAEVYFSDSPLHRFWQNLTAIYNKGLSGYKSCFLRSKK